MSPLLTSRNNPWIKKLRLIAAQHRNAPRDLVIAEGIRVIREAVRSGNCVEAILIGEKFGGDPEQAELLSKCSAGSTRVFRVSSSLLHSLSAVMATQGALALVCLPAASLEAVRLPENPVLVCACGIQDPGNLGTLIRTSWAAGASMLLATKDTVSARNPKSVRGSAGACFHLPIVEQLTASQIQQFCLRRGISMLGTSPHAGRVYTEADFRHPIAILLGNEGRGLCANEWMDIPSISIPMARPAESLNVAAAGAVLLFEILSQRSGLKRPFPGKV